MSIILNIAKELKDRTGCTLLSAKKALVDADGNIENAEIIINSTSSYIRPFILRKPL